MSQKDNDLEVRSAVAGDAKFIVDTFDSTLPYLASVGAGEMWGSEPFSQRDGFMEDIVEAIQKVEDKEADDTRRILVVERRDPNGAENRVAAAMIRDALPDHLHQRPELAEEISKALPLLYLEVLIADHRAGPDRKGAGAAVIQFMKRRAQASGKRVLYTDAWAGNARRLNRYYADLGFAEVGDFSLTRKNGSTWTGTLLRLDLSRSAN
ncbi:hypothetical protein BDY17DRAFT_302586 [Neohortaea acidophila]|uniref:N-acetyltransferase domain-containing protein n=1 Tax=Neohortaea acidophila TaxID=245834 RepID=A0A6A6PMM7_9PEZI|nr:uncharacterized protein BDY17DRAFT_302586 [Neohortaea acidophila]KAF2480894.1 hypothetical protein BDY17DRAFT_302586 [Neohortaea acidophila]